MTKQNEFIMVKQAEFIKSLTDIKDAPEVKLPEVVLLGRSNVGKSSFINAFCNRKSLARVSQTPGKTITLNYYLINNMFYLVDAPGYGYAKRSKEMKFQFSQMLIDYLEMAPNLEMIFLFVDFKVGPTVDDIEMYHAVLESGLKVVVIATKKDKVKRSQHAKHEKMIREKLTYVDKLILSSSETKEGYPAIFNEIEGILKHE